MKKKVYFLGLFLLAATFSVMLGKALGTRQPTTPNNNVTHQIKHIVATANVHADVFNEVVNKYYDQITVSNEWIAKEGPPLYFDIMKGDSFLFCTDSPETVFELLGEADTGTIFSIKKVHLE